MNSFNDIKTVERKVYQSVFQDGIYDLVMGFFLLVLCLNPFIYMTGIPKAFIYFSELLLAGVILYTGKKYITLPRMGIFKSGSKQKKKSRNILYSGIILNLLLIIFILLIRSGYFSFQQLPSIYMPVIYSVFFISVFTVLSFITYYSMLFFIGVFVGISIPLSELLYPIVGEPFDFIIPFGLSAFIMLIVGFYNLYNFIKTHPKEC